MTPPRAKRSFGIARPAKPASATLAVAAVPARMVALDDAFFEERRAKADFKAFDRIMARQGGEPPIPEDALG